MTRKIFLDVGAFNGEAIKIALNPIYSFDYVYGFEPSPKRYSRLRKIKSSRLNIYNFGLSSITGKAILYGANTIGASVYPEKRFKGINDKINKYEISLIRASSWISKNTRLDDLIYLKLNCEGSEADILEDLIETKIIHRVKTIYVDFDIRKVKHEEYRQDLIENQLKKLNIEYFTPIDVKRSGPIGVERWLKSVTTQINNPSSFKKIIYTIYPIMPLSYYLSKYAWRYIPTKLLRRILKLAKPNLY